MPVLLQSICSTEPYGPLNAVNCIVCAWTITSLESRYLPGFLKPGYRKKTNKRNNNNKQEKQRWYDLIHIHLPKIFFFLICFPMFFCKFWSKNYTVWPILSFWGFSITYHQKFILSISSTLWKFGSGHGDYISVIKYNTGWPILSF